MTNISNRLTATDTICKDKTLQSSRFGEALRIVQDKLDAKNFYTFNPEVTKC